MTLLLALLAFASTDCQPAHAYGPSECEVRTLTLPADGDLTVRNDVSGAIAVRAWDRDEIEVRAEVRAYDSRGRSAADLLAATVLEAGDVLRPVTEGGGWVEVAFTISVPRDTDLDVRTNNGSVSVEGVAGTLRIDSNNGAVRLTDVSGDVEAKTSNGNVVIDLEGETWDGDGLSASTRNGDVRLVVPERYAALVDAGTSYGSVGGIEDDGIEGFRSARESARLYLGAGGPTIRLRTRNGDVQLVRG
ncbi:DUF4097 family beta strand repeat-containing protein [Rubrivirga sp.]|uniref:DUF4097 family beta strand repeat-containing protein n=1 Tax=Rubrivirga sp. TaxID=1885344 RepID=UPI003C751198